MERQAKMEQALAGPWAGWASVEMPEWSMGKSSAIGERTPERRPPPDSTLEIKYQMRLSLSSTPNLLSPPFWSGCHSPPKPGPKVTCASDSQTPKNILIPFVCPCLEPPNFLRFSFFPFSVSASASCCSLAGLAWDPRPFVPLASPTAAPYVPRSSAQSTA
jgi:hypothetical protein